MDDCVKAKQSKERKTEREEEKDGPDGALLAAFHIFLGGLTASIRMAISA